MQIHVFNVEKLQKMICNVYFSFQRTQTEFKKIIWFSEILIENTYKKNIWQN